MPTSAPTSNRVANPARQLCLLPPSDLPALFARLLTLPASLDMPGIYNPVRTFWLFLWQALSPNHSCQMAVSKALSWCVLEGQSLPSNNTSGYCQARERLSTTWVRSLAGQVRDHVAGHATGEHYWFGLRPKVIDGSTLAMADTPANQARWPQSSSQKPGCGFPTMRIVGLFCLATGRQSSGTGQRSNASP